MRAHVIVIAVAIPLVLAGDSEGKGLPDQSRGTLKIDVFDRVESEGRRADPDTVWFGGFDGSVAVQDGIWDFEDGTLQGWTSVDISDMPNYMRRVIRDDFITSGSPVDCTIDGNASMWCGAFEDEARAGCWPGGQGYSNYWYMHAQKTFTYAGTGNVTLEFDYFVDSERDWDFTYVYVIDDQGTRSDPLRSYSGSVQEGNNIGSPDAPALETITVTPADLPSGGTSFTVDIFHVSDVYISDGLMWIQIYFDSVHGPFGFDNFWAFGEGLSDFSDFENGTDGWVTFAEPAVGTFMAVRPTSELEPVTECPLMDPDNDYVLTAFDDVDSLHHPHRQWERMLSPPVYLGPGSGAEGLFTLTIIDFSAWWDVWTADDGRYFYVGFVYYPWTCPETGAVGWSHIYTHSRREVGGPGDPQCGRLQWSYDPLPANIDSVRVVIDMESNCRDIDLAGLDCDLARGNQSPYWDDVRLGVVRFRDSAMLLAGHASHDFCTDPSTNQNGVWEPGEMIRIEMDVAATSHDMTNVTGTLTTTSPYVTVTRGVATWPDIPAGATATSNAPHFLVEVDLSAACPDTANFKLTVSSDTVGPIAMSFSEHVGAMPAPDDLPVDTIDNDSVSSELVVAEDVAISDLDVHVQVTHTWIADLSVTLTSPSNTTVTLLDQPGVPASQWGCEDNNMDVIFDDDSGVNLEDHCAGTYPWYQGTAAPFSPLSAFNGESTAGTWTLTVTDSFSGDGGHLDSWRLLSTPSPVCVACIEVVAVGEAPALGRATLSQNRPNPFNPQTQITFGVVDEGNVTLDVYSVTGRLVRTLVDESLDPGTYEVEWDGIDSAGRVVASGMYFYRLTTGEARIVRRMSVLK